MLKRQGDILFELTVPRNPLNRNAVKLVEDGIIAKGETTGHAHALKGDASLYRYPSGPMYIDVITDAEVVHEEHGTIELEPGIWLVHQQREYVTPTEMRNVYD